MLFFLAFYNICIYTYIYVFVCLLNIKIVCKHQPIILLPSDTDSPTGKTTGIPIHVFGTETHMTAIVGMALGHRPIPNQPPVEAHTANFLLNSNSSTSVRHVFTHVVLQCAVFK